MTIYVTSRTFHTWNRRRISLTFFHFSPRRFPASGQSYNPRQHATSYCRPCGEGGPRQFLEGERTSPPYNLTTPIWNNGATVITYCIAVTRLLGLGELPTLLRSGLPPVSDDYSRTTTTTTHCFLPFQFPQKSKTPYRYIDPHGLTRVCATPLLST